MRGPARIEASTLSPVTQVCTRERPVEAAARGFSQLGRVTDDGVLCCARCRARAPVSALCLLDLLSRKQPTDELLREGAFAVVLDHPFAEGEDEDLEDAEAVAFRRGGASGRSRLQFGEALLDLGEALLDGRARMVGVEPDGASALLPLPHVPVVVGKLDLSLVASLGLDVVHSVVLLGLGSSWYSRSTCAFSACRITDETDRSSRRASSMSCWRCSASMKAPMCVARAIWVIRTPPS